MITWPHISTSALSSKRIPVFPHWPLVCIAHRLGKYLMLLPLQHHRSVPLTVLLIDPTDRTFTNTRVDTTRLLFFWCLD